MAASIPNMPKGKKSADVSQINAPASVYGKGGLVNGKGPKNGTLTN